VQRVKEGGGGDSRRTWREINEKPLFKIQKITNGLIASKFFMGSRLYGIFFTGVIRGLLILFFFYFPRNGLTFLAFGVYIILVRNFFLFLLFLLGGTKKKAPYSGEGEGRAVGRWWGWVAVEVVQKNTFLSLLLSK